MIRELISNKENYFWSKSEVNSIIIGGYNGGRFYGQIEISIDNEKIIIKKSISNSITESFGLANISINKGTVEYDEIINFYENIDEYLNDENTKFNQEANREKLMQNVFNFLPNYSDIK